MPHKSISFHRQYLGYTGGHQKVRDYLDHFCSMNFSPMLYLEGQASTKKDLFSGISNVEYQTHYQPEKASIAFLAGMDWQPYLASSAKHSLIFNLIQHVRHGDKNEQLFEFLAQPAVRLCVSNSVKQAIEPFSNGPCHVVKIGTSLSTLKVKKQHSLYILANKQPDLGQDIYEWAIKKGISTKLQTTKEERIETLKGMASSHVTLSLPNKSEGFYLPGIESMFYSDMAVVPYCVANKEYYSPRANLIIPTYTEEAIKESIIQALNMNSPSLLIKKWVGRRIAKQYSLESERRILSGIVRNYTAKFG